MNKDPRTVGVQIRVTPKQKELLATRAAAMGQSLSAYAQLIFDAAYAARIGLDKGTSAGDRDLDEQCRLVFALAGQADTASIAKATGVAEPRVVKILAGWKEVFRAGADDGCPAPGAGVPRFRRSERSEATTSEPRK